MSDPGADMSSTARSTAEAISIPITTLAGFKDGVRAALEEAARAGCRELWLSDPDFAAWPLGERAVVEQLTGWARASPQRKFHLLAASFDAITRLHPRWVAWRRQWAHQVECRSNTEVEAAQMPTMLLAPGAFSLRLFDQVHVRGRWSRIPADMLLDRAALDAVLQQSHEAFAATVVGL